MPLHSLILGKTRWTTLSMNSQACSPRMETLTPVRSPLTTPHWATLSLVVVTWGRAPAMVCSTERATMRWSGFFLALGVYMAMCTARTSGRLRQVTSGSSGKSTSAPRGPRFGRFFMYGDESSHSRSRTRSGRRGVPGGVCLYISVIRSAAIVEWYVCLSRGRLKGPGTKSRATGSDEGGGWTGCRGPL